MTRILIADNHAVVRSGVRSIIESHAGWSVVAEAADGKEAIDKAIATKPDVAILAVALPLINGIEVTRQIKLRVPQVEVLIFQLLTARERSIVQLVAEGRTNKEIANVLSISVKTVETHRASILRKLNLASTAALVRYAVRHKMIEP